MFLNSKIFEMEFIAFYTVVFTIFIIGFFGIFLNRKNIILIIMSVELLLLSINFGFLTTSVYTDDYVGQILAIFVLTVAAAESSIGLAILVIYFRIIGSVNIELISLLRG
jgi:NADH-quinone oxidoreductase subunit K